MKTLKLSILLLISTALLFSCDKSEINETNQNTEPNFINMNLSNSVNSSENEKATFSNLVGEDFDLFTDYYWMIGDGRYLEDSQITPIDWVGPSTPRAIFRKLEAPDRSIFYQYRLRKEMLMIMYQINEIDKLFRLENFFSNNIFDLEFRNNFSTLIRRRNGSTQSQQERAGEQPNKEYPLIGIWGELPHLTEYRLIDPTDCLYYLEIYNEIPYWAVREGTYLLKQIDDSTFETITSFPDGHLRLEITGDNRMILRPLFTLPDDEEGLLGILVLHRNPFRISDFDDDGPF